MQTDQTTILESAEKPWFECEAEEFERELSSRELDPATEELVRSYREQGYIVVNPELQSDDIDAIPLELADRFRYHSGPYFSDETRIQDGWVVNERIRRVAAAPAIDRLLTILYDRKPIPFQTLNFCKGSEQATHSDTIHFHSIPPGFMCGVWMALEDIDDGNGPLHYYPKSQTLPLYTLADLGIVASTQQQQYENYHLYEQFVTELMLSSGLPKHTIKAKRGDALIWSANLFHGGDPIREKGRSRWSQVTHFYFEGCTYYTPLLSDPHLDKWTFREIRDVRTGESVPTRALSSPALSPDLPDLQVQTSGLRRTVGSLKKRWDQLIERAIERL